MARFYPKGYTTTELLVTMVLLAIIAAVAYSNFVDFRSEAKEEASKKFATDMTSAIQMKDYYVQIECGALEVSLADVQNNNVTEDSCDPSVVPVTQRSFVNMPPENFPKNPVTGKNSIVDCSCQNSCDGSCSSLDEGYCFNQSLRIFFPVQIGC